MDYVFSVEGNRATATPFAAGPWDPTMQHGGAPSALVARAAEHFPAERPMRVARLTVDLLRPVPVGALDIETEVIREGRKIQLLQVRLLSAGKECVRASVLKLRDEPQDLPPNEGFRTLTFEARRKTSRARRLRPQPGLRLGHVGEDRPRRMGQAGPGRRLVPRRAADDRGRGDLVPDARALTADFSNGVSSVLDFQKWTYINADLSVSFARDPVGSWILLDAETWVGNSGGALACARLADRDGYFGRAVQTVLIEKRG